MAIEPVCSSLVVTPGAVLSEPFLAVHPGNPSIIALAANSAGIAPQTEQPANDLALFISEDAGTTWRLAPAPGSAASGEVRILADPALAFLDDTLVFGAMTCPLNGFCEIMVATTDDLGMSWNGWHVVSEGGYVDREWIAVDNGTIYMDWTVDNDVQVKQSMDGGMTWTSVARIRDCIGASPIELLHGNPHLACVDFTGTAPEGIRLAYGSQDGSWATMDDQRGLDMTWPRVLDGHQGPVLILEDYRNQSVAIRSMVNGSWGAVVDVRTLVSVDDSWTRTFSHWEAVDAWGRLHLVLGGESASPLAGPNPDRLAAAYAHVIIDGSILVGEQALTGEPLVQPATLPLGNAVAQSDYAGLVLLGGDGILAWPERGGIAVTLLQAA